MTLAGYNLQDNLYIYSNNKCMCVFLISPVPIAEPLTSELIDTPVFYNLAPRPIKYRVSVPIPNCYCQPVTVWNYWNITATARFIKGQLYATYIQVSVYNESLSTEKSSILSASHEMFFLIVEDWSGPDQIAPLANTEITKSKHSGHQLCNWCLFL